MPLSKNQKKQKEPRAEIWLQRAGYSVVDINRLFTIDKIAFIKQNHTFLSKICQLNCSDIVAALFKTNGEKNLSGFMTHYYALKKLGFSQENFRKILSVESAYQSIEIIIEKADRLFGAPLKLSPDQVTGIVAWPEGNVNVSTLLQYQDIVLDFGLADSLEYFTTTKHRETFVTDLAEVIIADRLLYGADSDDATTIESMSLSSSMDSSLESMSSPSSMNSSPWSMDRQGSLQRSPSPYQPSMVDISMIPGDMGCQNQVEDTVIEEPPRKRHRLGIVLPPMDDVDTKNVIDSFLILFESSEAVIYATNSLCNLLHHMESRKILNESLTQWLLSNDTNMKNNVLKFICTLMLDAESENTFMKAPAIHCICELLHDVSTKDNVMATFNQWLQSSDVYWSWFARETIKSLLAIGPSATAIVTPPSRSVVITAPSLSNLHYGHNFVSNVGQNIKKCPCKSP